MVPIPPIRFDVELSNPAAFDTVDLPAMLMALKRGALLGGQLARGVWTQFAQGLNVRRSGEYIRGIQDNGIVRVVSETMDAEQNTWEIVIEVVNTAAHASIIEDGHGAFHLPSVIDWTNTSGKIKRTKAGTPYLQIPFRHRAYATEAQRESQGLTPGTLRAMMPVHVYKEAMRLSFTQKLGVGPIHNAAGGFVAADRYKWGGRLDRGHTRPSFIMGGGTNAPGFEEHRGARQVGRDGNGNPLINPAWQSSKYHGLFRAGSAGHAQYMTIRTITPTSPGWNIPAQLGLGIARRVASKLQSTENLGEVVLAGIRGALAGRPGE